MLAYRLSPDCSREAASRASNGSFDSLVPTLHPVLSFSHRPVLKKAKKKWVMWWMQLKVAVGWGMQRGRGRGNANQEYWRAQKERKDKSQAQVQNTGEKLQQACVGENKDTSFYQTQLFLFLCFILLVKCWCSPAFLCRKLHAVFPACVWQGGSWGLKFSWSRSEFVFDEGIFSVCRSHTRIHLETHLWASLSWLPARSKRLPPLEHIYISP